jgi:hypothetical protein
MRLPLLFAAVSVLTAAANAQTHPTHPDHPVLRGSPTRPATPPAKKPAAKAAPATKGASEAPAKPLTDTEPDELDAERLAVAPRVLVGEARCEMGKTVGIQPHPTLAGRFVLTHGKDSFTVTPQPTNTGVIRLENARAGLVWLQVPIKSMLMDAKRGQRLADTCLHPEQAAEANAVKLSAATTP